MLELDKPFPLFTLPDQGGQTHSLADYAGRWLVIYFYPKDNTGGCTLEAKDFTCLASRLADRGAAVIGVSPDSVKSHANFASKQELGFTLLSDPEHALLTAAGVWRKKKLYGREYMGVARATALVDPKGVVRALWSNVKVPGHAEAVLAKLTELQG
jgi:peroxiredoxin Q/BCP